jgi:hypothetical protein
MTFIGGAPPKPTLINPNFSEPKLNDNTYVYIDYWAGQDAIPGWAVKGIIMNNSTAWGYPIPYPKGSQAICMQNNAAVYQNIYCKPSITYTVGFYLCGRPGYVANTTLLKITDYESYNNELGRVTPTPEWLKYSYSFTVPTEKYYQIQFIGETLNGDNCSAINGVTYTTSGDSESAGTYTYDKCQQAAIDNGYQYFSLQGVNSETSTGYCGVSNSLPTITRLGSGVAVNGQPVLWMTNTVGENPGKIAVLNPDGSLAVNNADGVVVFSTEVPDNLKSDTNAFIGCYSYSDNGNQYEIPGSTQFSMTFDQCQDLATDKGYQYFGIGGGSREDKIKQCFGFNDIDSAKMNGISSSCKNPNGGVNAGSVYATDNAKIKGACYLVLQDDGNMCIYRGTGPSDYQGSIWCSMTNGKQLDANPNFTAEKGKYGKNWIFAGDTLAPGDFVGSTNGDLALVMQTDGNLVLYTFTVDTNCQKMNDGYMGAGQEGNAIYDIGKISVADNMSKLAFVDENSELHPYPSSNIQYANDYTKFTDMDITGYDIPGAAYGNSTVEQCQNTCDGNPDCGGFIFNNTDTVCYPKTADVANGSKSSNSGIDSYLRNKGPITPPSGVSSKTFNVDTVQYQNYVKGGDLSNQYGLASINSVQKKELGQLEDRLNILSNQMNSLTNKFSTGSQSLEQQVNTNSNEIDNYLLDIKKTNEHIKNFNTSIESMLNDSDIVVLQKNYDYLFWSILAVGSILVTMNIMKK